MYVCIAIITLDYIHLYHPLLPNKRLYCVLNCGAPKAEVPVVYIHKIAKLIIVMIS